MNLLNFISDASSVNAMPPEELANILLRILNSRTDEAAQRPGGDRRQERFQHGNFCNGEAALYEQSGKGRCLEAIGTAWNHLVITNMLVPDPENQNGWHFVSSRGRAVRTDNDYEHFRKVTLYPRGSIHRLIESETYSEFLRGDYETAVFKAFKMVEVMVRRFADLPAEMVGRPLMAQAFNEAGALTDSSEVKAEQESLLQLFMGAIGRFKNPTSHREVNINDPAEAIEMIQLASLLMRIVWDRGMAREGFKNLDAPE